MFFDNVPILGFFVRILAKNKHKEGHKEYVLPLCQRRRGVSPLYKGRGENPMFKGFRAMAHLLEQLGDERFAALINSDNTGKVKEFCDTLVKDALPTTMTVGDRTYDILGFLREGETSVVGHTMVERAKEMSAHLGADDGQYLLDHQQDIPVALRGKVAFVFTDWRHPVDSDRVYCVCWYGGRWVRGWFWLDYDWHGFDRVLRRK